MSTVIVTSAGAAILMLVSATNLGHGRLAAAELSSAPSVMPDRTENPLYPTLAASAATARLRLSASTERFLGGFDAGTRTILTRALASASVDPQTWPQVMAGTVQIRHQSNDEGETLWFNPVLDAGLVVQWHRVGSNWTITNAWSVLGESLRQDAGGRLTPLLIGDIDRAVVSDQFTTAARELPRFVAPNWRAPVQTPGTAADVVLRVRAANDAIAAMRQSPGYARAVIDAYELLSFSGPETEGIRPGVKRAIAAIDSDTRMTLRPVTAFRVGADWTVVMQSSFAPGVAWFVSFDRVGDAPVRIASASMTSYAELEAAR